MTKPKPRSTAAKRGGSAASPKPAAKASAPKPRLPRPPKVAAGSAGRKPPRPTAPKTATRAPTAPPPETASPAAGRWKRPAYLQDDFVTEWWDTIVAELRSRGRLHVLTPVQVAQFCQLMSQWWYATEELKRHGTQVDQCITDSGNIRRSVAPEVRLQLEILATLRRLAKDFGLNEVPLHLKPGKDAGSNGRDQLRKLLEAALGCGDAG